MERDTNYTIAEGYRLPSEGLIYDVAVNPEIELRSMSARDEMKRLNPTSTPFKTLAEAYTSYVGFCTTGGYKPYNMGKFKQEYLRYNKSTD